MSAHRPAWPILPDPDLCRGCEHLDFCLETKKARCAKEYPPEPEAP